MQERTPNPEIVKFDGPADHCRRRRGRYRIAARALSAAADIWSAPMAARTDCGGGADARGDHRRSGFTRKADELAGPHQDSSPSPSRTLPILKRRSTRPSAPVTVALGMTGKRFDHTLAALDAVARQASGRPVILVDEADIAIALSGSFAFRRRAARTRFGPSRWCQSAFANPRGSNIRLTVLKMAPGRTHRHVEPSDRRAVFNRARSARTSAGLDVDPRPAASVRGDRCVAGARGAATRPAPPARAPLRLAAWVTASWTFSNARTSIWRMRSRLTLYCCASSSSVAGLSCRRRAWKIAFSRSLRSLMALPSIPMRSCIPRYRRAWFPGRAYRRPASPAIRRCPRRRA